MGAQPKSETDQNAWPPWVGECSCPQQSLDLPQQGMDPPIAGVLTLKTLRGAFLSVLFDKPLSAGALR